MTNQPPAPNSFCFLCCQQGSEPALKAELDDRKWRLAFSRPGFVTLKKVPAANSAAASDDALPEGIFIRTASWSIGKIAGEESDQLASQLSELLRSSNLPKPDLLHLWGRDRLPVGERGFMPGNEPLTEAVADFLAANLHQQELIASPMANQIARPGDRVLDVVMVESNQWWIGWHEVVSAVDRWPGGTFPMNRDREVISRAYYKTSEAIAWSGFQLHEGDQVIEIGSAPGGSVQRLLELGMQVSGIDPAEMDESIMEHKNYRHFRARGGDIKRHHYSKARWLLVDSNVKPEKTLTTVENIVQHRDTSIVGMLLTLKLSSYERAADIPIWLDQIRSWGYSNVRARQLATGRTEICVAATV
ncbi:putative 23S rRNA ribose 2'-O-ribose methyltransferase [Rosistilla oblonga]|uniref:SAM-dependent methyltransferase n=1 Tax=Rosistilla oblonga TaxID=2527990 RepID=UPI001188625F|nr:SAM-dependent methyltransferase [Rosistilla oblonga]QDV13940.1 putative 23S rRNA ribose 2'-O-ribose methyltransferase [Rosistilla oblonga]